MSPPNRTANLTPGLLWALASPIGRLGRQPYWLGFLLIWIIIGIAMRLWWTSHAFPADLNIETAMLDFVDSNPLFPFLFFGLQWVELALVIKRSQDAGLSGFLGLLIFVPVVGILAVIVIGALPSASQANRHGPLPNSYYRRAS